MGEWECRREASRRVRLVCLHGNREGNRHEGRQSVQVGDNLGAMPD